MGLNLIGTLTMFKTMGMTPNYSELTSADKLSLNVKPL